MSGGVEYQLTHAFRFVVDHKLLLKKRATMCERLIGASTKAERVQQMIARFARM
jgi:hypothetical protein